MTHQITVTNVTINTSLAAIFTVNTTSGAVPLTVLFTDKSTGSPTNRSWNFGDGNNSTAINPTHTYYVIGVYPVTLNVSNVTNCSSSTQSITVTNVSNPPITPPAAPSNIMYVSAAQAGQLNGGINSTVTGLNISRSSRFISNQGPLGSLVNTVTGGVNNGLTLVVLCIGLLAAIVLLRGLDYL